MSRPDESPWSQQAPQLPMGAGAPADDFANFFDLDNIDGLDLNFPILDSAALDPEHGPSQGTAAPSGPPPPFSTPDDFGPTSSGHLGSKTAHRRQRDALRSHAPPMDHGGYGAYQQKNSQNFQWLQEQHFQQNSGIPPTPNSTDIYPSQYPHHQPHHSSYTAQFFRPDDAMALYTPIESPQVMGSESSFSMPEFAVPGTYNLSPLTSPAMQPQSQGANSARTHTAESSLTGSPVDLDFDMSGDQASPPQDRPRKTRRRTIASRSSAATAPSGPRQPNGPTSRKRKGSVSKNDQPRSGTDALGLNIHHIPPSASVSGTASLELPTQASLSLSPTSASGSAMAPPPKPSSVKTTPTILPQSRGGAPTYPPATPASLMRLPQQQVLGLKDAEHAVMQEASSPTDGLDSGMQELSLPEAAAPTSDPDYGPSRYRGNRHGSQSVGATPLLGSDTPRSLTAQVDADSLPGKGKAAHSRSSRKRNSTSSTLVSPALRPRISPSIKPLLPDAVKGAHTNISDETHALLLASKSNYQNLLEGNSLPGVNYPSELSTNLTSKRTSHKIAEQGRRNRINTALQEMQCLLPPSPAGGGPDANAASPSSRSGGNDDAADAAPAAPKTPLTPSNASSSKASTVEQAIDYIKNLNTRLAERESENSRLKMQVQVLQARLERRGGGGSSGGDEDVASDS